MASPVLTRRRPVVPAARRAPGHGRSRSRRGRRRQSRAHSDYGALALIVFVVASSASLLTSLYLLSLINY